jgi:hypothetical protein
MDGDIAFLITYVYDFFVTGDKAAVKKIIEEIGVHFEIN